MRGSKLALGFLITLSCTGCLEKPRTTIPVTTSSDAAREAYLEGRERLETVRIAQARPFFEKALDLDPDFALAQLALANSASTQRGFFEALRRAVALAQRVSEGERRLILGMDAGVKGDFEKQRSLYDELVRLYPEDERARTTLGTYHMERQEYALAAESFDKAIELNPSHAPAYNLLGYATRFLEQYERAEQAFGKYVELIPDEPNPYDSYAELLMKMGRFEESIQSYTKALELDPGFVASHVGIGNDLIFMGQPETAREKLHEFLDRAADDGERRQALLWIAVSYLHQGEHERALAELQRGYELALRGNDAADAALDLARMGDILADAGAFDRALASYTESLATMEQAEVPEEVKAARRRELLYKEARLALAREDLRAAATKTGEYRRVVAQSHDKHEERQLSELNGLMAMARGDHAKALRFLTRADSKNPRIMYLTALTHQRAGNRERARSYCEKAANFNALDLEYAYVRNKALDLLARI